MNWNDLVVVVEWIGWKVGTITPTLFNAQVEDIIRVPLRAVVTPLLQKELPSLRKEIGQLARRSNQVSSKPTCVRRISILLRVCFCCRQRRSTSEITSILYWTATRPMCGKYCGWNTLAPHESAGLPTGKNDF